jgi:CheY-like chemotaxis protein
MQGDLEKFLSAGFDGYLSKPISTRELPDLVKGWLAVKQFDTVSEANPVNGCRTTR